MILRYLLYSAETLFTDDNPFDLYPAILCVCRQIFDEGYEILYHHNTAEFSLTEYETWPVAHYINSGFTSGISGDLIARRFTKWTITVTLESDFVEDTLDDVRNSIFKFASKILSAIPNLNKLKGKIRLCPPYDIPSELWSDLNKDSFANKQDFAEQVFRSLSMLRVRDAEFVDSKGYPLHSTLSLSRLMMSDTPPPITLYKLFKDLTAFLDGSLSRQARAVINRRLALLKLARDHYDVDAFGSALRPILHSLSYYRGLVPPQHLVEFAQDSAPTATDGDGS